jgi:hypothetical protein
MEKLTLAQIEELRKLYAQATEGLEQARAGVDKLASIGVKVDLSSLETAVATLARELALAEERYAAQNTPKTSVEFEELVARVTRLELMVDHLRMFSKETK